MTEPNINIIPECISKPLEEGLTPVTKSLGDSVGHTLSVAWQIAFGGLDATLQKLAYKRQKDVESFRQELNSKINKIPLEDITEAEMHIIGPTLEASKYYFEKEDLRNMFSSLIASSVDKTKSTLVHPSFVEIIKQLSSTDAENIIFLSNNFNSAPEFPIVNYSLTTNSNSIELVLEHVLINQIKGTIIDLNSVNSSSTSLVNLQRLGLIYIYYDAIVADFNYNIFTDTNFFNELQAQVNTSNRKYISADIQEGHVKLTPLGVNFIKVCL